MESMRHTLFENPTAILVLLALVELAVFGAWWSRRTKRLAWALAGPVVLVGMFLGLAWLVKTDREQILDMSERIAADLRVGKLDWAAVALDDTYHGWGGDKKQTLAMGQEMLDRFGITNVQVSWTDLAIESGQARMRAQTLVSYSLGGGEGRSSLQWDIWWTKRREGWRIIDVLEPQQAFSLGPPK